MRLNSYSNLSQLGLTSSATTDNIIDALAARYPAMLSTAMFKSDYPNIKFGSTGQRHVYTVIFGASGYVSIQDNDVSNGITYFCGHYGTNYTAWTSSKPMWKLVGNGLGTGTLSIPAGAEEIMIKTNINSNDIILTQHIPVIALYTTSQSFRVGYYQTSTNGSGAIYNITTTGVTFNNAFLNGATVTTTTAWSVYYR